MSDTEQKSTEVEVELKADVKVDVDVKLEDKVDDEQTARTFPERRRIRPETPQPVEWTEEQIIERSIVGRVKAYEFANGFGFIVREGEDEKEDATEYRVFHSSLLKPNEEHLIATLEVDEPVIFDLVKVDDVEEAINVTALGGKALKGYEKAPKKGDKQVEDWAIHLIKAVDQPSRHYGMSKEFVNTEEVDDRGHMIKRLVLTPKWEDKDIIERGVVGKVQWFQLTRGYGFIARDDDADAPFIFVHRTSILKPNDNHIIESLDGQESLKFDILESEKGKEAVNVTAADGGNVQGKFHTPNVGVGYVYAWAFELLRTSRHLPPRRFFFQRQNTKAGTQTRRQRNSRRRIDSRTAEGDSPKDEVSRSYAPKTQGRRQFNRRRNGTPKESESNEALNEDNKEEEGDKSNARRGGRRSLEQRGKRTTDEVTDEEAGKGKPRKLVIGASTRQEEPKEEELIGHKIAASYVKLVKTPNSARAQVDGKSPTSVTCYQLAKKDEEDEKVAAAGKQRRQDVGADD